MHTAAQKNIVLYRVKNVNVHKRCNVNASDIFSTCIALRSGSNRRSRPCLDCSSSSCSSLSNICMIGWYLPHKVTLQDLLQCPSLARVVPQGMRHQGAQRGGHCLQSLECYGDLVASAAVAVTGVGWLAGGLAEQRLQRGLGLRE